MNSNIDGNITPKSPTEKEKNTVDLDSLSFKQKYLIALSKGMTRKHTPNLNQAISSKHSTSVSEKQLSKWHKFVGHENDHIPAALTFSTGAGVFGIFDVLNALSINFIHLLHLKSQVQTVSEHELVLDEEISVEMVLDKIIPRKNNFVIVMKSEQRDANGTLQRVMNDYWLINKAADTEELKKSPYLCHESVDEFKDISRRTPTLNINGGDVLSHTFFVPKKAGRKYAKISGDYNFIHTTNFGAKLIGHKRAFLQGYGILNLCIHHITQLTEKPIDFIEILFSKPTYENQQVTLYVSPTHFEVCDDQERLLVFGQYKAQ